MKAVADLTTEEVHAADLFRALGNPARVRILRELAKQPACMTGELVELLPLAQSTVSGHLRVLKEAGLVQGTVDGGDRCYCLDPAALETVVAFCQELLDAAQCCRDGACC